MPLLFTGRVLDASLSGQPVISSWLEWEHQQVSVKRFSMYSLLWRHGQAQPVSNCLAQKRPKMALGTGVEHFRLLPVSLLPLKDLGSRSSRVIGLSALIPLGTLAKSVCNQQGAQSMGDGGILFMLLRSPVLCLLFSICFTDVLGDLSRTFFPAFAGLQWFVMSRQSTGYQERCALSRAWPDSPGINRNLFCRTKPESGCWMQGFHHLCLSHQLQVTGRVLVRHFRFDIGIFILYPSKASTTSCFLLT